MQIYFIARGIFCMIFVMLFCLAINLCQMVSISMLLFSKTHFTKVNMWFMGTYCNVFSSASRFCGNKLLQSGDPPQRVRALVLGNHQSYFDIPIIWMWAKPVRTNGWMKWFVKDEFKWVPGFGWGLWFIQAIFVKRNWTKDESTINATFQKIRDSQLDFWIMIFPEGTRLKRQTYSKLKELNLKKPQKYLPTRTLVPRPKGVWATLKGLHGSIDAIYDVSIAFEQSPPTAFQFFCGKGQTFKLHSKRYEISSIPTIERDFNDWLLQRFYEKDLWMKQHSGWDVESAFSVPN
jgi:lysocardiolipin and lysophospholipid acyltransferase